MIFWTEEIQQNSDTIAYLVSQHQALRNKMIALYERYKATNIGVPIFKRKFEDTSKINNRVNNDFFSEIIDTKIGYFMGNPISYVYDREEGNSESYQDIIDEFNLRNNTEDLDSEIEKTAAICGMGARLYYIDTNGKERMINVPPWEVIFIFNRNIDEPIAAVRYYEVVVNNQKHWKVEWYDKKNVTYYTGNTSQYILDTNQPVNPQPHMFDDVPLVAFLNNDEIQGDCEKAIELIDAYDRTISDVNSEIEQFRLAYMAFYGVEPTKEVIESAKQTGAFGLPEKSEGVGVEFITKNMNDTMVENHLNRLEDNILRFTKSVNFSDESFGGNISGIAMKFKVFALESKCILSERKMTRALRRQYQLLQGVWNKRGESFDFTKVWYGFKRNLPLNLLDEAQTSATFKGIISEDTRLSLLSFVDDVQWEKERMEEEASAYAELSQPVDLEQKQVNEDVTGAESK